MPRTDRSFRGFTLIELLVAVGIISVLISILLPSIGRARAAASRTQCLSNLRNVHQLLVFYAEDNRDQVPIGYRIGNKQFNSMVFSSTGKFVEFGLLYQAGYMDPPATFFCPAESNPQSMLNSSTNPWPPGSVQGYAGFGGRPDVNLPDDPKTIPGFTYPKLAQFKSRAMLADLTATPQRVLTRHVTGINILRGDGAGKWVQLNVFEADLKLCTGISASFNPHQDRIWASLDRQ